jgi:hypothetical protein
MLLTYDFVLRTLACRIQRQHGFSSATITDWGQFCREAMLVYMENCSEKIGGPNKTVEIDESKFGERKYGRGHPVKGCGCLAVLSASPGKRFLFPFRTELPTL